MGRECALTNLNQEREPRVTEGTDDPSLRGRGLEWVGSVRSLT